MHLGVNCTHVYDGMYHVFKVEPNTSKYNVLTLVMIKVSKILEWRMEHVQDVEVEWNLKVLLVHIPRLEVATTW